MKFWLGLEEILIFGLFTENRKCNYGFVCFNRAIVEILPFKDISRNRCQKETGNQNKNEQQVISQLINQEEWTQNDQGIYSNDNATGS